MPPDITGPVHPVQFPANGLFTDFVRNDIWLRGFGFHRRPERGGLFPFGASLPFPCTSIKAWFLPNGGVIPLPGKGLDKVAFGVTPSDWAVSHGVTKELMKRLCSAAFHRTSTGRKNIP